MYYQVDEYRLGNRKLTLASATSSFILLRYIVGWYTRAIELTEMNATDETAVYYTNRYSLAIVVVVVFFRGWSKGCKAKYCI